MQSIRQIRYRYFYLNDARPAPRDDHSGQGDKECEIKRRLRAALDPEFHLAAGQEQAGAEEHYVAQQG